MANRIPVDTDVALDFRARLTVVEQCSLAILHESLVTPEQWRLARRHRRKAVQRDALLPSDRPVHSWRTRSPTNEGRDRSEPGRAEHRQQSGCV